MNKLIIIVAAAVAGVLILVLGAVKGVLKAPFKLIGKLLKTLIAPFKKLAGKGKKEDKGSNDEEPSNEDPRKAPQSPAQDDQDAPKTNEKTTTDEKPVPGGKDDPDNPANAETGKDKPEEPAGTTAIPKQAPENKKDKKPDVNNGKPQGGPGAEVEPIAPPPNR